MGDDMPPDEEEQLAFNEDSLVEDANKEMQNLLFDNGQMEIHRPSNRLKKKFNQGTIESYNSKIFNRDRKEMKVRANYKFKILS